MATWMSNVGNECGQVLNSVLTTGEGAGLGDLSQGIVQRYRDADEPQPAAIYVDRDCCSDRGVSPVLHWFWPWTSTVRLDVFHFMGRFTKGLTTEHHPLYGTFCSKLSSCIFELYYKDICNLKEAKRSELRQKHQGYEPTDAQVSSMTKLYDIHLMSNVNALSNKVLGKPLLPEFIPPGKPTGERIAVEYLLAQSNRGDLLSQQTGNADILDEDLEDECPDVTVPQAHDLTLQVILCQQYIWGLFFICGLLSQLDLIVGDLS
ncbi:uncharacterized protein [Misgurnus anguillicaudatus]|uniref:uncharacterized protein n=1 Tax=Misgurnus anguillicaudatus TaxID=75329 RepID=UPI003CCEFAFC